VNTGSAIWNRETAALIPGASLCREKTRRANFSGFPVVLFLQGLAERGDELLGRWREEMRYQPSETAAKFKLDIREDLRLRQEVRLKNFGQLAHSPATRRRKGARGRGWLRGCWSSSNGCSKGSLVHKPVKPECWTKRRNTDVTTASDIGRLAKRWAREISETVGISGDMLKYRKAEHSKRSPARRVLW